MSQESKEKLFELLLIIENFRQRANDLKEALSGEAAVLCHDLNTNETEILANLILSTEGVSLNVTHIIGSAHFDLLMEMEYKYARVK